MTTPEIDYSTIHCYYSHLDRMLTVSYLMKVESQNMIGTTRYDNLSFDEAISKYNYFNQQRIEAGGESEPMSTTKFETVDEHMIYKQYKIIQNL